MYVAERIEAALERALRHCEQPNRSAERSPPPSLRAAMRHAVFPGGARLRPGLCLAVAAAVESDIDPQAQADVASAIELLHCASLVHDDLPCFDDAAVRRGRPSVHAAHGEELAVLAGDGLIVLAFDVIARAEINPVLVPKLIRCIAAGVGVRTYHKAKTGALFEAGARAGALLSTRTGRDIDAWAKFGLKLGEAYQVADDLRDTLDDEESLGKPVGQDMAHNRPNACISLGIDGALARLRRLLDDAIEAMPVCPRPECVVDWVEHFGARLYPHAVPVSEQPSVSANSSRVAAAGLRA
jgi:geranylgeranyl diphosphate synthase type II